MPKVITYGEGEIMPKTSRKTKIIIHKSLKTPNINKKEEKIKKAFS